MRTRGGIYRFDPKGAAEFSALGWLAAAWIGALLVVALGSLDPEGPGVVRLAYAGLIAAVVAPAPVLLAGRWLGRAAIRLHRGQPLKTAPMFRVVVMVMFVASFFLGGGLVMLIMELG